MAWLKTFAGLGAVAMLALGFNMIAPLSGTVDTLCDTAGIVCVMLFFGLAEDTGGQDDRFLDLDRE